MSARFTVNFAVLLLAGGLMVITFAFSGDTVAWVAVGVGVAAILLGLCSFALAHQGAYQRIADVAICVLGGWAIVAGRVLTYRGRWVEFATAVALAALGAVGLVVREVRLRRGPGLGESRIGPDQFAALSARAREAGVKR